MPPDETERWRVFLAVEIPDAVRTALQPAVEALQPLGEVVRANALERIHLTLHFLGHLPRPEVEQLPVRLEPIVAAHRRRQLQVEGVGAFPGIGRPQVLWAGVGGTDLPALIALQAELGVALRASGVPVEDRFHPHLTLARVKRPVRGAERQLLRDWAARWQPVGFGDLPVDAVQLMRSQLGGGPARYTTLWTFPLQ